MNIPQKNWLEWTVFAVGLALVVSVLAYLVYDAVTLGDAPPMMAIQSAARAARLSISSSRSR